jgi:hypothetical protein
LHISSSDVILLAHAAFGVTGCLAAIWVFVEALNARPANGVRIQTAAQVVAVMHGRRMALRRILVRSLLSRGKGTNSPGPWPFAHNVFMGTKEHLFFVTAILAFLFPITARENLYSNSAARALVLSVAALIAITGLAVEGAGAVIDHGVKLALLQRAAKGIQ